jgi:RsmE family RNA methyltransferase
MLLALPRPKMLKRTLQTIATMGVKHLYLINSYRVEKSYWQTPYLQPDAIEEELLLGLEQGVDTLLPRVHLRQRFKPFVEDELPALIAGKQALLAHPADDAMVCPRSTSVETVVALGPEGGFIPYEITKLKDAGFTPVTLGTRILRVETAVPVILAKLFD